ncbi:hypothetical protein ACFE04_018957 [Oxalis oulophora]
MDEDPCKLRITWCWVSEFSPSTSSDMGLPREFHEQCRMSLELDYLKSFYCWARDAASSATNKIIESTAPLPEVKVRNAALRLMLLIYTGNYDIGMVLQKPK